jgi:hypothetical protein
MPAGTCSLLLLCVRLVDSPAQCRLEDPGLSRDYRTGCRYGSSVDCLRKIVTNEGPRALYKGVGPRMVRAMLDVGITMSCYSEIVKLLERVS